MGSDFSFYFAGRFQHILISLTIFHQHSLKVCLVLHPLDVLHLSLFWNFRFSPIVFLLKYPQILNILVCGCLCVFLVTSFGWIPGHRSVGSKDMSVLNAFDTNCQISIHMLSHFCVYVTVIYFSSWNICSNLLPTFIKFFVFLLMSFENTLHILPTNPLSDKWFANIFSMAYLFLLLTVSSKQQEFYFWSCPIYRFALL